MAVEQKQYLVTWEIDIDADSPMDAAKKARLAQTRKGTLATVFTVAGDDGSWQIDLIRDTEERQP